MERFEIVPATRNHANQLAPSLRMSDVVEIWASSGLTPLDALIDSIEVSDDDMCWAALYQGLPVAMFGANPLTDNNEIGGIWLLASPGVYHNKRDFWRACKSHLELMHTRYEYLTNFIDERNLVTMAWLPRLGFKPCQRIEEFGYEKLPFIQYVSQRK